MKTKIHYYSYDLAKHDQAAEYAALSRRLRSEIREGKRGREMHAIGKGHFKNEVREITLGGTLNFWANQWNAEEVGRVFDWYEATVYANGLRVENHRSGHWLEITDEMRQLRETTRVCGYTGRHFGPDYPGAFNVEALGSEYLQENELCLLRLVPVVRTDEPRAPLSPEEAAVLVPQYREAQLRGDQARQAEYFAARLRRITGDYEAGKAKLEKEFRGFLWMTENRINQKNCIYYSHTGKFCFGWQRKLSPEEEAALLSALEGFPFPESLEFSDK